MGQNGKAFTGLYAINFSTKVVETFVVLTTFLMRTRLWAVDYDKIEKCFRGRSL